MDTNNISNSEVEARLQWFRENIFERWIEVDIIASPLDLLSEEEKSVWQEIHEQGYRGQGLQTIVVDYFSEPLGAPAGHGYSVAQLVRAIAPKAFIAFAPLSQNTKGVTPVEEVVTVLSKPSVLSSDIVNISYGHPAAWEHLEQHRDQCIVAKKASTIAADQARWVIAATGNWGLGVLGCPCLSRGVHRVGASKDGLENLRRGEAGAFLSNERVGTSFSCARVSGLIAVLASMYPTVPARTLFDMLGILSGSIPWPTHCGVVSPNEAFSFFRSTLGEDGLTDRDWDSLERAGLPSRWALWNKANRERIPRAIAERMEIHRARAWQLVAGYEMRRIGRELEHIGDPSEAAWWYDLSVKFLEASGLQKETALGRLFIGGALMDIPGTHTVIISPEGKFYRDPLFERARLLFTTTIDFAQRERDKEMEAQARSCLCALLVRHNDFAEIGEAVAHGQIALRILGQNPRAEESMRCMLNLSNALFLRAQHLRVQDQESWKSDIQTAEALAKQCADDKYEDTLKYAEKAKDLLKKIRNNLPLSSL